MLTPGICSVTLQSLRPEEVVRFAADNNLHAIEWWATGHVTPGAVAAAETIGRLTREAGLAVSSYGSYYRVGANPAEAAPFEAVLDSAQALQAATIRVWAGRKNMEDADDSCLAGIVADTMRVADLAATRGLSITFEHHGGSLTNTSANARRFADIVPHRNVFFSWQPPHGFTLEHCRAGLELLLDRLSTVHVYHWTVGSYEKNLFSQAEREPKWPDEFFMHPLADGLGRWTAYLERVRTTGRDHCALLEFVKGGAVEQAAADAATLVRLCQAANSRP